MEKNFALKMANKYSPRTDLNLCDAVTELKYLVSKLNMFAIVMPSSRDILLLKEIVSIVDGMDIPEIVGEDNNVEA